MKSLRLGGVAVTSSIPSSPDLCSAGRTASEGSRAVGRAGGPGLHPPPEDLASRFLRQAVVASGLEQGPQTAGLLHSPGGLTREMETRPSSAPLTESEMSQRFM